MLLEVLPSFWALTKEVVKRVEFRDGECIIHIAYVYSEGLEKVLAPHTVTKRNTKSILSETTF